MVRALTIFGAAALCLLTFDRAVPAQAEESVLWPRPIVSYSLNNGLRVILYPEPTFPVVSVVVAYRAGTAAELPGQSGMAYLLENLMFEGSENVGPRQHYNYIQKAGGILNALTTFSNTVFYQTLPSNQLALAIWLESDRMKSLIIDPVTLEKIRGEILEEHTRRMGDEAYFESFDTFDEKLYQNINFTYAHPMIGTGEDLRRFTAEDVAEFRTRNYAPNNALLCIVGDIDVPRTKELVARYFDSIRPGESVPPPPPPVFEQREEIQFSIPVRDPAKAPGFHMGFRFFPLQTGDVYTLHILEYLLLKGDTSRLVTRLLKRDRSAFDISGVMERRNQVMALKIFVINNTVYLADRSRRAIISEIEKIKTNPVSETELDKAKSLFAMEYAMRLSTSLGRALYLADAVLADIPVGAIPGELDRHLRINPETISNLVQRHFQENNRVVLRLVIE